MYSQVINSGQRSSRALMQQGGLSHLLSSFQACTTSLHSTRKKIYCLAGLLPSLKMAGQQISLGFSGWSTLMRIQRVVLLESIACSLLTAIRATTQLNSSSTARIIRLSLSACCHTRCTYS